MVAKHGMDQIGSSHDPRFLCCEEELKAGFSHINDQTPGSIDKPLE
jgi:hypothetical protein